MIETLIGISGDLTPADEALKEYRNYGVMQFLQSFSNPVIQGSVSFNVDDTAPANNESVTFLNGGRILLQGSSGGDTPFNIKDGESFVLQCWIKPGNTSSAFVYNDLIDRTGENTLIFIVNSFYQKTCMMTLDVKHVNQAGSDNFGNIRYRMGLGSTLPVGIWSLLRFVCDGATLTGYVNDVVVGSYPWMGAVKVANRDFVIGSSVDGAYDTNASISGFRLIKWPTT